MYGVFMKLLPLHLYNKKDNINFHAYQMILYTYDQPKLFFSNQCFTLQMREYEVKKASLVTKIIPAILGTVQSCSKEVLVVVL